MADPRSAAKRHDPKWIAYRLALMDRFAIPSVARQTRRSFQWIWEIDPDTPEALLRVLERKAAETHATIVFDRNWYPDQVVIMTRFDSDDFLSARFVQSVQTAADAYGHDPVVIDTPAGWKTAEGRIWPVDGRGSTFVSLVANPRRHGDVWQCSHRELVDRFPCVAAPGRLWCVVIHGDNLLNRLRRRGPGRPLSDLDEF